MDDWLARTSEIVDKYQPELIWFDWWIEQPVFQPYLQKFAAFYYNRGAEWNKGGVAINYKNKSFPEKAAVLDIERGKLDKLAPVPLADRHLCRPEVVGLYRRRGFPFGRLADRRPDRHLQQERRPAAEHRASLRWDDSGRGAEDPARHGQVARRERRGRLWHPPLEGLRRRSDRGLGRRLH